MEIDNGYKIVHSFANPIVWVADKFRDESYQPVLVELEPEVKEEFEWIFPKLSELLENNHTVRFAHPLLVVENGSNMIPIKYVEFRRDRCRIVWHERTNGNLRVAKTTPLLGKGKCEMMGLPVNGKIWKDITIRTKFTQPGTIWLRGDLPWTNPIPLVKAGQEARPLGQSLEDDCRKTDDESSLQDANAVGIWNKSSELRSQSDKQSNEPHIATTVDFDGTPARSFRVDSFGDPAPYRKKNGKSRVNKSPQTANPERRYVMFSSFSNMAVDFQTVPTLKFNEDYPGMFFLYINKESVHYKSPNAAMVPASEIAGQLVCHPGFILGPQLANGAPIMTRDGRYVAPGVLSLVLVKVGSALILYEDGVTRVPVTWKGYVMDQGPKVQIGNDIIEDGEISYKGPVTIEGELRMVQDAKKEEQQEEAEKWTCDVLKEARMALYDY